MGLHHKLLVSVTTSPISHDADASEQQPSWHQETDALTLVVDSYAIRASSHASTDRACLSAGERSAGTDLATVKLPTTLEAGKDTNDEVGNRPISSFATNDPVTNAHAQTTDMAIHTDQSAEYDIHIHRNYLPTGQANDQIALRLLMSKLAGTGKKS